MRKISDNISAKKAKNVMKAVNKDRTNNVKDIEIFNLNKRLTPERVDRVEVLIKKTFGKDKVIAFPRESVTFLNPVPPYEVVESSSSMEDNYIVVPWNIGSASGRNELLTLINQMPSSANLNTVLQYTVFENSERSYYEPSLTERSNSDFIPIPANPVFDARDDMDRLQDRIKHLEQQLFTLEHDLGDANVNNSKKDVLILEKDEFISNLNIQLSNKQRSIDDLEVKVKNLDATVTSLQTTNATLQSTNANLQSTNTNLQTRIAQLGANQTVDLTIQARNASFEGHGANWLQVNGVKTITSLRINNFSVNG